MSGMTAIMTVLMGWKIHKLLRNRPRGSNVLTFLMGIYSRKERKVLLHHVVPWHCKVNF